MTFALSSLSRYTRFTPLAVFFVIFATRLLILIRFSQSPHFIPDGDDMKFYSDWALRITHGQWTDLKGACCSLPHPSITDGQSTDHQAFYGLPGYAFCLAVIYKLSGGLDPFAVGLLQAAFDAAIGTLLYQIARVAFAPQPHETDDRRAAARPVVIGLLSALLWMLYTPAQAFSLILMPTVWLVLAYYTCVYFAVKTSTSTFWHPWLALGIFVGGVTTLVATILFAIPLLLLSICLSLEKSAPIRKRLPKIALAFTLLIGGVYLGSAPVWMHNYFIAREPVLLSAHSGINFWVGNNPTANGYPKMPPGLRASQEGMLKDSLSIAERELGTKLTRAQVSRFWSAKAQTYIAENPRAWLQLLATKFANFWNAFQYDDVGAIKRLSDDHILPPGFHFGWIATLGLAGTLSAIRLFPRSRWVAAAVLLHLAALLPVFVTERYRLAAVPGLIVLGSFGLWHLWDNLDRSRWGSVGLYLLLTAGAASFVFLPRPDPRLWSLDFFNAGIRSLNSGDLPLAESNFQIAYAYVPDSPETNFALGNLFLEKSNHSITPQDRSTTRSQAKNFYRQTLALQPQHSSALNNLGVLALEEKRWDLAEKFFLASLAAEPDNPKSSYLLARVRFESGHPLTAKAPLDYALSLQPNQKQFLELQAKIQAQLSPPPTPTPEIPTATP